MILRHLCFVLLCAFAACASVAAQTCQTETAVPSTTPANRFADNSDGTVVDRATGLMWARCPEGLYGTDCANGGAGIFTWEAALTRARDSGLAGYTDWRLPNVKELASLVEERCISPAINLAVFPNTPSSYFWSASPAGASNYVWVVHFSNGYAWYYPIYSGFVYYGNRLGHFSVRLVRSGQ